MALSILFNRSLFNASPVTSSLIKMTPLSAPIVSASLIAGAEPLFQRTDLTGSATFTGSFAGSYKVEFLSGLKETIFYIQVPEGNGTINAKDYIYTPNPIPSGSYYTKPASDALFVHKDNLAAYFTGSGVTITPTTQGGIQTLTFTATAGSTLMTGSTVPITASRAITSSVALALPDNTNLSYDNGGFNFGFQNFNGHGIGIYDATNDEFPFFITASHGSTLVLNNNVKLNSQSGNSLLQTDASSQIISTGIIVSGVNGDTISGAKVSGSLFGTSSVASVAVAVNPNVTLTNWTSSQTMSFDAQFNPKPQIHVIETGAKFIIDAGNYSMFLSSSKGGNLTLDFAGAAVISTAGITSSLGLNGTSSNAISSSFASKAVVSDAANSATSASYSLFASTTPAALPTGSTQNITASWASNVAASNVIGNVSSASYATFAQTFPAALPTGSTQNITASVAVSGGTQLATGSTVPITSSWAINASSGSAITSSANVTMYLDFSNTGSGLSPTYTNLNLYYNPATGSLFSTILSGSHTGSQFGTSSQAVSSSYAVTASYAVSSSYAVSALSASWAPAAYSLALQQIGTVAYNSNTTYYFGGSQNVLNTTSPQNSYVDIPSAGTMTRVSYHINVTTTGSYAPDSCSLALILNNNNNAPFAYTTASFSTLNATHSFQNLVTSQSVNVGDTLYCRLMMCAYSGSLPTSDKATVFCFIQ